MSYLVIARKWRPQTFADIAGQEPITRTLQNAIRANRIAHAFLFTGVRGVGKTTAARILAKALNCEEGPTATPCDRCTHCQEITQGKSIERRIAVSMKFARSLKMSAISRQSVGLRFTS